MTTVVFHGFLVLLFATALLSLLICRNSFVVKRLAGADVVAPPTAASITLIFGLFIAFGTSEIGIRSRELNLAVRKEVSVSRSIFSFAEGVGPSTDPLRNALVEYLQAVSTSERMWLENPTGTESPAQPMADAIVLNVTLFLLQSPASGVVNSLILNKVDELRIARTERISLALRTSNIAQWVILAVIAAMSQLTIGLGYVGKRTALPICLAMFTVSASCAYLYLAWIDGLIGPSKIAASMQPLAAVLREMSI
jgi:hypothetical protein